MIASYNGKFPKTEKSVFLAWNADISGQVRLEENVSVWFSVTIRGDVAPITIGARTNIQDNSVLHVDSTNPLVIGEDVTVGHGVILHGCNVGNACVIGMGAIVLSGSVIGEGSVVAAGALVPEGKTFPPKSLIMGIPGKIVRQVTEEEIQKNITAAANYIEKARETRNNR